MFGIDTKIPVLLMVLMGLKTTDFYCAFCNHGKSERNWNVTQIRVSKNFFRRHKKMKTLNLVI